MTGVPTDMIVAVISLSRGSFFFDCIYCKLVFHNSCKISSLSIKLDDFWWYQTHVTLFKIQRDTIIRADNMLSHPTYENQSTSTWCMSTTETDCMENNESYLLLTTFTTSALAEKLFRFHDNQNNNERNLNIRFFRRETQINLQRKYERGHF